MPRLLEREDALTTAEGALAAAAGGNGQVVLISGEAGIGKTSCVRELLDRHERDARFFLGGCDELGTPRPYGPLFDLVRHGANALGDALDAGGDIGTVLEALLDDLTSVTTPAVVLVEDVHWIDSASLDVLTMLSRRITDLPATLVLTYRELERSHIAFGLLGSAPPGRTQRIKLSPLSPTAVAELAGRSIDEHSDLYEATGGNPFYVSELLAARGEGVPATISDAVLARTSGLDAETRDLLDLLSVIPGRMTHDFLDELDPTWTQHAESAAEHGLLDVADQVTFRHALTRKAIEQSLSAIQRRRLNRQVLEVLVERDAPLAEMVHHAHAAGAENDVVQYAPAAAREAVAATAHRQAISHFLLALAHEDRYSLEERADLHDELSREYWFAGEQVSALSEARTAISLCEEADDHVRLGRVLRSAANLSEWNGDFDGYRTLRARAVEVLEPLGPSADLAMLYGDLTIDQAFRLQIDSAEALAARAIEVADAVGDADARAIAYVSAAYPAHWARNDETLWRTAIEAGAASLEATVVAFANRAFCSLEWMHDDSAASQIEEAMHITEKHEASAAAAFVRVYRARLSLKQGEWSAADGDLAACRSLVDVETTGPLLVTEYNYVAGRLAARRGDLDATELLNAGWHAIKPLDQVARFIQLAVAQAELAELSGDVTRAIGHLEGCTAVLADPTWPWSAEVAYWLWRAGAWNRPVPPTDHPRHLAMRGEWIASAEQWGQHNRPYERAEALIHSGDVARRLEGLAILDALGALPLAAATRKALREDGVERVPRGPNRATRDNLAGLTARQIDVLALVGEGLTNAEIAERLFLSVRTVDTHVGAILQRLGAETRRDATRQARELGILET